MDKVFILTLVLIFIIILAFMIFNTMMGEYFFPIMNQTAGEIDMINQSYYQEITANIKNQYWTCMYILLIIPFGYLLMRIFKREPQAQQYPYGDEY